jgi:hypothetical protein
MFEIMKIVGLSAVLSAGLVTASEVQPQPGSETIGGKIYSDRVPEGEPAPARFTRASYAVGSQGEAQGQASAEGKGDLQGKATPSACASQAWPHIAPECLGGVEPGSARGRVRVITVEQRLGVNTSALVRIPASDLAVH